MRLDSFFEGFVKEARAAGLDDNTIRTLVKDAQAGKLLLGALTAAGLMGSGYYAVRKGAPRTPAAKREFARSQMIADALKTQERVTSHRLDTEFMKNLDNYNKGLPPTPTPRGRYYI